MILIKIYIFDHLGPQMQAGILHSENYGLQKTMGYFAKIAIRSTKLT